MSSNYPSYYFRDPLTWAHYMPYILLANETIAYTIDLNVAGDSFLKSYIVGLDEEIFAKTPDFKSESARQLWDDNGLKRLWTQVANESRKHGWCVIKFYDDETWKVLSPRYFEKWIFVTDTDGRRIRTGVKMNWTDDLGNNYPETCDFGADKLCFLIKWAEPSNKQRFAEPDLNQALMTRVYNIRQINDQLVYSGTKPNFYHFIYGSDMTDDGRTSLKTEIKNIDRSTAFGMRKTLLEEIKLIPNGDTKKILDSLDKQIKLFAGVTRLPLSFYEGERTSGGQAQAGEEEDELRIDKKKNMIFSRLLPYIKEVMLFKYGETVEIEIEAEENDKRMDMSC